MIARIDGSLTGFFGSMTLPLTLLVGVGTVLAVLVILSREHSLGGALGAIIFGGFCIFLINGGMSVLMDMLRNLTSDAEPSPAPTEPPLPVAPDSPASAPADYSGLWAIIGIVLACIVALILVIAGARYLHLRLARKSAEVREKIEADKQEREKKARIRAEEVAMWARTLTTAEELDTRWMKYQTELDSIILMPLMTDLGEPTVMAASRAHLDMLVARAPEAPEGVTIDSAFPTAVREFTVALRAAEDLARKTGLRRYDPAERKTIHRAHRILGQALGTNSEAERATCYEQVLKMLSGLVTVPEPAIEAIEASAPLLAIEASSFIAEAPTRPAPEPVYLSVMARLRESGRNLIHR